MIRATLALRAAQSRVGVIGIGHIGQACTRGLLGKGHEVVIHDVNKANTAAVCAEGAEWRDSPSDVAADCEVLVTALPAAPHVREVMEQRGCLAAMREGTCWIDHTTTQPNEAKRLAGLARERGLDVLEAPLTGGLQLLQQGMMTVLLGGDQRVAELHRGLLGSYIQTVIHVGDLGTASVLKIITNQLAAVHLVATGEALLLAKAAGVDMQAAFDGIRASAGNSYVFETEAPLVFNRTWEPGFTIGLHCKDLDMGAAVAQDNHVPSSSLPLITEATRVYHATMQAYGPNVGSSSPARWLEETANPGAAGEANPVTTGEASTVTEGARGLDLATPGFDEWTYRIRSVSDERGAASFAVVHGYGQDNKPRSDKS